MTIKRIDPDRAKELLESDQQYVYLDVRLKEEFQEGHVPSAKNLPVMVRGPGGVGLHINEKFVKTAEKHFGKRDKIIIGCKKGGRSQKASQLLVSHGFTSIYDMRGGFVGETDPFGKVTFPGWSTRGLPISTNVSSGDILG